MPSLPFARWNLCRNPFGEPPLEDRTALFVGDLLDWPQFLMGGPNRRFLQLLGPSGCGKTSRLRALQDRFPDSSGLGWCPVEGWSSLPTSSKGPLFVDDAQELSRSLLAGVLRYRTVAVATQRDLSDRFARAGFEVWSVGVQELWTIQDLHELVECRLEWARRGPGEVPRIRGNVLSALFRRHGPDVQSIQSDLYDRYQQLEVEK
jgi:hypothetical protein